MRKNLPAVLALVACCLSFGVQFARANDTTATVETGNVTFKKSRDVSMESEELVISPDKISVKYLFRNNSMATVQDTVVFPLPDSNSMSGWGGGESTLQGKDPLGFILKEDGVVKPFRIHAEKIDVEPEDANVYRVRSFYSWQQVFPAKKSVVIEHEYNTGAGSGGSLSISEEDKKTYCIDDLFLKSFEKLKPKIQKIATAKKKSQGRTDEDFDKLGLYMHYHSFSRVSYILTTANNWAGPIGKFRLVVKKDKPSTLVSFCWNGLKKVSTTEFESVIENFSPTRNLDILYVHER